MRGTPLAAPSARSMPLEGGLRRGRRAWLLVGAFVITAPLVNPYIRGDGNGYYAYVRSVVIDGDLRFENEYRRGDPAFIRSVLEPDGRVSPSLALGDGYVRNQWAVGPSLLWAPAFLLAHGVTSGLGRLGWEIPADGYSPPYRWLCALATAIYAFVGLALAGRAAEQLADPGAAQAATIGVWFASPLPVYMYFLPFHVPALSAFAVSVFVWYWLRTRERRTAGGWAVWGLSGGLMVQVYYLNAVCLLLPALDLAREVVDRRVTGAGGRARTAGKAVSFALGALTALLPHVVVKSIVHGSPFRTGYEDHFFWSSPRLWQVAFASEHGMFLWTPVLLLGAAGLGLVWRRDRWAAAALVAVFIVYYYVVASYENWHGQSAFGSRFMVSLTPVFIVGLAQALSLASKHPVVAGRRRLLYATVLGPLILWNMGLMLQWGTGLVPNRGPVDFAVVARNQMTQIPGGVADFLGRYLVDREQVTRAVERGHLERAGEYRPRR